ncbi:MAG: GNAT family N-acetyltransferase [Nevskiales bacterium]|nr:GNAT family N-acetyltransferase [Nevskiales bacterium]
MDVINGTSHNHRLVTTFAHNAQDLLEAQRLRYRVFAGELGARIKNGDTGVDADRYDPYCQHLLVREAHGGRIIACTRILTDRQAALAGGFYSGGEFRLDMIQSLPGRVMEVGRTCVDAEFRNGAVIATLWQGLAGFFMQHGFDYLFGCASISLADGGIYANAVLNRLREQHLAPPWHRVHPLDPLPAADAPSQDPTRLPPLIKAYVSLGARVCGEACWDRDFNCADVFMLLYVGDLNPRYARHFLEHRRESRGPAPVLA